MHHKAIAPFSEVQRCRYLHEVEGMTFYAVSVATGYNYNTVADWLSYKTRRPHDMTIIEGATLAQAVANIPPNADQIRATKRGGKWVVVAHIQETGDD